MEPLLDKLARQMPRYKRYIPWMLCGVGISVVWFFVLADCALGIDDGNAKAHPFLVAASRVMDFPLGYIPVVESWSFELIANCLLWGFFLVWIFRLILRRFQRRRIV
jgi:hypothetical protein